MDLSTWTPERAWWLGATFGDGYADNSKGRRRLHFSSGDKDFVEKWAALFSVVRGQGRERLPRYREDHGDWACGGGCVKLTEWLATYGMDGRKGNDLSWPPDMPVELAPHFVRGLLDSDGHVKRVVRTDGRRDVLNVVLFMKAESLIASVLQHAPLMHRESQKVYSGPYEGRVYPGACVRGKKAVEFARWAYIGAPEHLRCERKYQVACEYVAWWDANKGACERCGREVVDRTICKHCAQVKWTSDDVCVECKDPTKEVYAKGVCSTCYCRLRRREKKSWGDEASVRQLSSFPVAQWSRLSPEEQGEELTKLTRIYREKGFPWFVVRDRKGIEQVRDRVGRASVVVEGDEIKSVGWSGQRTCLAAHPHRLKASYRGTPSPVKFFGDDESLKRAIRYQLDHGDPVTPSRVVQAIKALCRCPTNFPPALARWLVDGYGTDDGIVLDPCAGYGGRLLGTMASLRAMRYVGQDVEPRTVKGNQRLADWFGCGGRVSMRLQAVEDDTPWEKVDLVLTCPPYFRRERYGTEADKRLAQYWGNYKRWRVGFLGELVRKSLEAAPTVVICVAPLNYRKETHDIPAHVASFAESFGGIVKQVWRWRLASFGASVRHESVMVLSRS